MRRRRQTCVIIVLALLLTLMPGRVNAADPTPATGNFAKWIDRIAGLPDYARSFYQWLEANSGAAGVLADPTKGTLVGSNYVYRLHTLKGSVVLDSTVSADQVQSMIMDAVDDDVQTVMTYAFDVYGAFDRDHPEVFWLDAESLCGMNMKYSVNPVTNIASYDVEIFFYLSGEDFDIRLECYRDPAVLSEAISQRDRDVKRILADCPKDEPVAEQVRYLNKVLTRSNAYNSYAASGNLKSAPDTAWKCVSALTGSVGTLGPVCEGYARALKVLCDKLGIPCVLTEGYARGSKNDRAESHMWNYVQLDGKWYAVDTTWNDPYVSGAGNNAVSGKENEKYLLVGKMTVVSDGLTFGASHQVRNSVHSGGTQYTNGPMLSSAAYVFPSAEPEPTTPAPTVPQATVPQPADPEATTPSVPDSGDHGASVPVEPQPDVSEPMTPDVSQPTAPDPEEPQIPDNYMDVASYRSGGYFAPAKEGCVFTGWFTDPELTQPLAADVTTGYAYAGFADADVLSVKCQISDGTTAQSEQTDLRLLTGAGTDLLQSVVFHISWGDADLMASDRYEQVLAHGVPDTACHLFGQEAAYILTCTISDVPRERFNESMTVIPGWYTLDGTFVAGSARTVCISDGL